MDVDARAIHAIDQGLAECRDIKRFWQDVVKNAPRRRRLNLVLFIVNTVFALIPPFWWMDFLNIAMAALMLKFYLDAPKKIAQAEHQIETWRGLERQWLEFLYAVREGRPVEGGPDGPQS